MWMVTETKTREMALGRLPCSCPSTGPQLGLCAQQGTWGALRFLLPVSHQPGSTSYSLPLKSLRIWCKSALVLPESRHCVNAAKDRTAPSWRDLQSLEMLRSSADRVHMQQRTRRFQGQWNDPVSSCLWQVAQSHAAVQRAGRTNLRCLCTDGWIVPLYQQADQQQILWRTGKPRFVPSGRRMPGTILRIGRATLLYLGRHPSALC